MSKITQGSLAIRLSGNRFTCKCGMAANFKVSRINIFIICYSNSDFMLVIFGPAIAKHP
jgi:hypothetical protein